MVKMNTIFDMFPCLLIVDRPLHKKKECTS